MIQHLFIFRQDGKDVRSPWCKTLDEVHQWALAQGLVGEGKKERMFKQVAVQKYTTWYGEMMKGGELYRVGNFPIRDLVIKQLKDWAGGAVRVFRSFEKWSDAVASGQENCVYITARPLETRVFREQKERVQNETAS